MSLSKRLINSVSACSIIVALGVTASEAHGQAVSGTTNSAAVPPSPTATSGGNEGAGVTEVIVTAQKRSESISNVGMSITAATGEQLLSRGITDTAQLVKVVPGFNFTETPYATPVYTIRGVGFQENSLAASPAVSVYVDEIPLPFPAETEAASLDLDHVEVLKGPQGTLYGENSTGGAVNYISAKPTNQFAAGVDGSFGRFDRTDLSGFVSGPITDTLGARLSLGTKQGEDWQHSYTHDASLGQVDDIDGRLILVWKPTDNLKVTTNFNGWSDRSDTPAAQAVGILPQSTQTPLAPGLANYPLAPANAQAADWDKGVSFRRNNTFYQGSLRIDYNLPHDFLITSITSYENYQRYQPIDADGTTYQDFFVTESGHIDTVFQELRLSGKLADRGHFIVGANYESDGTEDVNLIDFNDSSTRNVIGLPLDDARTTNRQEIETKAVFFNVDGEILPNLTLQGGVRYTSSDDDFAGCTADAGDGLAARIFDILGPALGGGATAVPGGCATLNANYDSALIHKSLDQDNVSWRADLNYKLRPNILIYGNISQGYKSGSFPTLSASTYKQFTPVTQEGLLAYETGVKATLFDRTLQVNAAAYYYDYTNKQIRGKFIDPIFGDLEGLVNIPHSHVDGFELSGAWKPVAGLTISPSITLVNSRIDGDFSNFTPSGNAGDFTGEAFPYTPKWSGNTDIDYRWPLGMHDLTGFVGANASYQSATNGGFGDLSDYRIRSYTLLDLRAGVEGPDGRWRFGFYGNNVTNQYYWTTAAHLVDTITRYAGMPVTYGVMFAYRFQ